MNKVFANGVEITVPDDVTFVFNSVSDDDDSGKSQGYVSGDSSKVGGLILGAMDAFFNTLDDDRKEDFVIAAMRILALGEGTEEDSDEEDI